MAGPSLREAESHGCFVRTNFSSFFNRKFIAQKNDGAASKRQEKYLWMANCSIRKKNLRVCNQLGFLYRLPKQQAGAMVTILFWNSKLEKKGGAREFLGVEKQIQIIRTTSQGSQAQIFQGNESNLHLVFLSA